MPERHAENTTHVIRYLLRTQGLCRVRRARGAYFGTIDWRGIRASMRLAQPRARCLHAALHRQRRRPHIILARFLFYD